MLPFFANDIAFLKCGVMKRRKIKMRVLDQSRPVVKMVGFLGKLSIPYPSFLLPISTLALGLNWLPYDYVVKGLRHEMLSQFKSWMTIQSLRAKSGVYHCKKSARKM